MTPDQINRLLLALSTELSATRATVEALSPLLAELAVQTPLERRSRVLVQAQAVDDAAQRLDAVRLLTKSLADGCPVEAAVDAVPLADLADRLRQALTGAPGRLAASPVAGDLILFD